MRGRLRPSVVGRVLTTILPRLPQRPLQAITWAITWAITRAITPNGQSPLLASCGMIEDIHPGEEVR